MPRWKAFNGTLMREATSSPLDYILLDYILDVRNMR